MDTLRERLTRCRLRIGWCKFVFFWIILAATAPPLSASDPVVPAHGTVPGDSPNVSAARKTAPTSLRPPPDRSPAARSLIASPQLPSRHVEGANKPHADTNSNAVQLAQFAEELPLGSPPARPGQPQRTTAEPIAKPAIAIALPREDVAAVDVGQPSELSSSEHLRASVLLRAARNAVGLGDISLAIARFEELFAEFPSHLNATSEYVGLLVQAGQLQKAERHLETIISTQPDNFQFDEIYADILIQQGKHISAETSLRRLAESSNATLENIVTFARVLVWQGKRDEANEIYQQRLTNLGMLPASTESDIAALLMELNRSADALGILARLHESAPENLEVLSDLILANTRLGHEVLVFQQLPALLQSPFVKSHQLLELADTLYRESHYRIALQVYQSASQRDPSDLATQAKIARTHVRLKDMSAAKATLDSLVANDSDPIVRLETANYQTAVGEHASAYAIYRALLNANPHDAVVLKGLGTLYQAIGDHRAAETVFRQGIGLAPNDTEMRQLLAEALLKQLRVGEATSVLEMQADRLGAGQLGIPAAVNPSATTAAIGDILLRGKEFVSAEAICLAALQRDIDPQSAVALRTTIGFAQLKQGRNSEALDTFTQTRKLAGGNSPKIRYGIYCCLMNMDRPQEAEAALSEELNSFGPSTHDRVLIAQFAMDDCNCLLAERLLQQASMFDPGNIYVRLLLGEARGMCNRCSGDCDDRSQFVSVLTESPSNTRAQLGLARSYLRTNDFAEGSLYFNKILAAFPQHELARIEIARLTYAWKGAERANCVYAAAQSRNQPEDYLPHNRFEDTDLRLMEIEYEQASFRLQTIGAEKSAKYFKDWEPRHSQGFYHSLTALDPTNQEAQFDLAQLYSSLDLTNLAIHQYDHLLSMDPCHTEARIAKRRMQLELQPQVVNSFDFEYRAGREGLTDITTLRLESLAIRPMGDRDEFIIAGYAHRFLRPAQGTGADGNVGIIGFQNKPLDYVNLFAIAELEQYDHGFSTRVPFRAGIRWRTPSDWRVGITGFLENVAANGEAIRQDTFRGGFEATAAKFFTPRWEMDALYRIAGYSDNNTMNEAMVSANYMILPGRNQLRARLDASLFAFREETQFGPNAGDLFGTVHPYFSPSAFTFATAGLEYRTWSSPHNFRGADERWCSVYGGARIDSDREGYGLFQFAAHRDRDGWLSAQLNTSAIFSRVYTSVAVGGFVTIRFP